MNMERQRIDKNKREQKRVKLLCKAFKELQELLPNSDQKKLVLKHKFSRMLRCILDI